MSLNKGNRLSDVLYSTVKKMIITSSFPLGYKIDESNLAEELDVSSTSIKEALKLLEFDGYVSFDSRIGYCVAEINIEDIIMLNDMLKILTIAAAENVNIYDRPSLIMIDESLKRTGTETNFQMDKKFHLTLSLATKNEEYINAMRNVYDKLEWGFSAFKFHDLGDKILDEHKIISYYLTKHDDIYRDNMPAIINRHGECHMKFILQENVSWNK